MRVFIGFVLFIFAAPLFGQPPFQEPPKEELPVGKTGNGYPFEYQSVRDGEKRLYRVRNQAGGAVIPAEWKSPDEEFLSVYIARCRDGNPCDWIETVKIRGMCKKGKTELSYGLNKDQFKEATTAFVWDKPDEQRIPETHGSLISGIKGRLSTADGDKTFDIDLTLASHISKGTFIYQAHSHEGSAPMMLVASKKPEDLQMDGVLIYWEAASSPQLSQQLREPHPVDPSAEGKKPIIVKIDGAAKLNEGRAILFYRGKEFARFSAAAYRSVIE